MQELLIRKLYAYISDNNPDLLLTLQQEHKVTAYLAENVASIDAFINQLVSADTAPYIIEELCMEELTKHLKPSRYDYLKELLHSAYNKTLLQTELINLITFCDGVFDAFNFSESNEDDHQLRHAIIEKLESYGL